MMPEGQDAGIRWDRLIGNGEENGSSSNKLH